MTDESLILDIDIIEEKYEAKLLQAEKEKQQLTEEMQSVTKENHRLRGITGSAGDSSL